MFYLLVSASLLYHLMLYFQFVNVIGKGVVRLRSAHHAISSHETPYRMNVIRNVTLKV